MASGRSSRRRAARGRALVLSTPIPDDATSLDKEGAVRRRLVATTGQCPCGAVLRMPEQLVPGVVNIIAVDHEDGCPAIEEIDGGVNDVDF
jgi:hypothetical protein